MLCNKLNLLKPLYLYLTSKLPSLFLFTLEILSHLYPHTTDNYKQNLKNYDS